VSLKTAFDFTGRSVLVVGASRDGIGVAIAADFVECGAAVRITGAEPEPIAADQERYPYTQLDISDPAAVQALAQTVPVLDVLVNCAGIALRDEEYDPAVFARALDVNLHGLLHLANAFKDHLMASQGAMVNIASMCTTFGSPRVPAYGASKAGVAQMTKSLALALAQHGVRVNAIAPGFIVTEQTTRAPMPRIISGSSTAHRSAAGGCPRTSPDPCCFSLRRRRRSSQVPCCPSMVATPPSSSLYPLGLISWGDFVLHPVVR
jgi:NAD(P)-dependent dehydrogenase (short-subunit alcohol dehydrogenase family)